ncbi:sigma-70 family RNA polymerase sigma factor [Streptomyces sp. NPDC018347]|uniref:sigma-70 family RNA polymerase sigma factor n=1 Tax=Streptomyces sp. NPDC018347 TaxID=3157193 RepID=UPI00340B4A41
MGADGWDESRVDDGDAETRGSASPFVPEQGGRPVSLPRPAAASVPAQRDGGPPPAHEAPPADGELIERMRAGDDSAYTELYRRHSAAVRRYARTCCRDGHTADDLTAEVFARMLQAVRGGAGPEYAVRAYLLTSVRRVAAHWARSARREQLVDDFALFAQQADRAPDTSDDSLGAGAGADVRALHEAEQSMAMRAFRSLPERWQAVLWHTEVEDESPSEVAVLFGLDANGTRVLASRAREGLRQAYLQAHVSDALADDEECARYADRLGTYARRKLRVRAERGLRRHLAECARCRLAVAQIEEVASGIPGVVPVAVIGWFGAAGYAKALGIVAGGAGAGAAGAAAVGAGGSSGGAGGAAASEGLGAPVKAGIAAGVVAVAAAAVALALVNDSRPAGETAAPALSAPSASSAPVVRPGTPAPPTTAPPSAPHRRSPKPVADVPEPAGSPARTPAPPATPTPATTPQPTPGPATKPAPPPTAAPPTTAPPPPPTSAPKPGPTPTPRPTPPPASTVYELSELRFDAVGDGDGDGDGTEPEIRLGAGSWVWQRYGLSIGGKRYARGVTVRDESSVTIALNRECTAFDALAGVDDMALGHGKVSFSVWADGVRLWRSGTVAGGDRAVPVHVDLAGRSTVRLVVRPRGDALDRAAPADWADSRFTCR